MKKMILLLIIFSNLSLCFAQNKREKLIQSFIRDVLSDKKDNESIIKSYIFINSKDTISFDIKLSLISAMLDSLRNKYKDRPNILKGNVVRYIKYTGNKQYFSSNTNDIEILLVNQLPVLYFYFLETKIISFLYIKKGSEAYFIIP